jgi:hypothetical protein
LPRSSSYRTSIPSSAVSASLKITFPLGCFQILGLEILPSGRYQRGQPEPSNSLEPQTFGAKDRILLQVQFGLQIPGSHSNPQSKGRLFSVIWIAGWSRNVLRLARMSSIHWLTPCASPAGPRLKPWSDIASCPSYCSAPHVLLCLPVALPDHQQGGSFQRRPLGDGINSTVDTNAYSPCADV